MNSPLEPHEVRLRGLRALVESELFYHPRTSMLFGDTKQSVEKLVAEVKAA